jgi:diguanylate cyclase (GGDEF)-like protein
MGPDQGAGRAASSRRLFAVYALASLIPVVVLGVLVGVLTSRQATQSGLRDGRSDALLLARSSIAPQLGGHDLAQGLDAAERATLRRTVRLMISSRQVLRLRLRDLSGRIVFSDDDSKLSGPDDEALDAARGRDVVHLTRLNADDSADRNAADGGGESAAQLGPRVVEAYVPLVAAQTHRRIGVLEVYLPYAPIAATIGQGERTLIASLVGGLFLLWLVLLGVSASVTRRIRRQADINGFLARHDALTGLANRAQFADLAAAAVEAATPARQTAIALIDLDRFKEVNDTLGHGNGDALLIELAHRLAGQTRDGDLVARLGGDEFGIILTGVHGAGEAVEILTRLRGLLGEPLTLGLLPLAVEASIGFAMAPDDGDDAETLLARADLAMYTAKREHRGVVRFHASQDQYDATSLSLVTELSSAIAADQLVLHYQPKADLAVSAVTAVEALVRWQHPVRGLLYPDGFLPAAEQTELVDQLTRWVLRRAAADLPALDPSGQLAVAVNISARSLIRPDFADDVLAILADCGTDPNRIILEITETALLADPDRAERTLTVLHAAGIRISIDDFGAGQTSLGYLARLPVSELKIDKAFVLAMTSDPRNAAIVRSVIELGHSLGFTVTAEGVETPDALRRLAAAHCDLVQGFLLARPMQAAQIQAALGHVAGIVRDSRPLPA